MRCGCPVVAELVALLSKPIKPRRSIFSPQMIWYDSVRRTDGSETFVQSEIDILVRKAFAEMFDGKPNR